MALTGNTNEEKVWNYLKAKGLSDYACAGFLGNFYAESGIIFNRVEILCLKRLRENGKVYNNETYTAAVDSGKISRAEFLNPLPGKRFGFGLAQWTTPTPRKSGLYDLCKQRGVSIADPEAQMDFLWSELNGSYKHVLNAVKEAKSVKEASDIVLTKFEVPANASSLSLTRASYSQKYYDKYAKKTSSTSTTSVSIGTYQVAGNMISNSGSDERGSYSGGTAGDQTGKEWQIRTWYNRPWNCVLRHPDETVRRKMSELAIKAANNNHVGYNQGNRYSYWAQLQKANYDPSAITTNCDADCSAGVIANTKAVGYIMGISALKNLQATYTGNMRSCYRDAGFAVLTESKYLTGPDYLLPGDILLNDAHHTAMFVSTGSKSDGYVAPATQSTSSSILKKGSSGSAVRTMQTMLIAVGYSCGSAGADGEFGNGTLTALKKFQAENGLESDGEYGPKSKTKLESLYKEKTTATTKTTTTTAKEVAPAMYKDATFAGTYYVTASALNVRLSSDTSSNNNIIEVLHTEDAVTNYGYYNLKNGTKWLLIVTPTGKTGYVSGEYVKK